MNHLEALEKGLSELLTYVQQYSQPGERWAPLCAEQMLKHVEALKAGLHGPYNVTFLGAGVWAGIQDELPGHLAGKKVYVAEADEK